MLTEKHHLYLLEKIKWDEREESWLYRQNVKYTEKYLLGPMGVEELSPQRIAKLMRDAYLKVYGTNDLSTNLKFVSGAMLAVTPMIFVVLFAIGIHIRKIITVKPSTI